MANISLGDLPVQPHKTQSLSASMLNTRKCPDIKKRNFQGYEYLDFLFILGCEGGLSDNGYGYSPAMPPRHRPGAWRNAAGSDR